LPLEAGGTTLPFPYGSEREREIDDSECAVSI
jgi:hypothetical protein